MHTNPLIISVRKILPSLARGQATVYFLRLKSGALYIGSSTDLDQRLEDHLVGQACRTTQMDSPSNVLRVETHETFSAARHRVAQLKRWSRAKKEALACGDLDELRRLAQSH